ncbi:MAG: 50S ribosomal protein L10 [Gammaproteobacteria bacterium]
MALKLEDKQKIVAEVAEVAAKSDFAVVASYRGLTVAKMTELRTKARQAGVYVRIVRNTLARRALQETMFACLQESLVGPLVLMLTAADPGEVARVIRDFSKENALLEVKALSFGNTVMASKELEAVANLPSRNQAIAMLLAVLQTPVTQLARTLAEPYTQVARAVQAIAEQKQAA